MTADTTSKAAKENYIHHAIAMFGVLHGLFYGRHWGVLSNAALFTEASTFFVNMRWLLYTHKKSDSMLYVINGLTMTLVFFVCRIVFLNWIIFMGIPPVYWIADVTVDPTPIYYYGFLVHSLFCSICILNMYWFYRMFTGCLKQISKMNKKKTDDKKEE